MALFVPMYLSGLWFMTEFPICVRERLRSLCFAFLCYQKVGHVGLMPSISPSCLLLLQQNPIRFSELKKDEVSIYACSLLITRSS